MRKELREAERMVSIFVASMFSTGTDAGWHQPSVLQMLMDYCGDLPQGTGMDQADLKMISEIRWVRSDHPELPLARALMAQIDLQQQMVMVVYTRLKGLMCAQTNSVWTISQMAQGIGMTEQQFTRLKGAGFEHLIELLPSN